MSRTSDGLEPADTGYGWVIVLLTLMVQAVTVGILIYSFAMFVVPWLHAFHSSRAELMLIIFLLQISIGLISPFCGQLLDRYSMRYLMTVGGCCVALGLCLVSLSTQLWQLALIYATLFPVGMVLSGTLASQTLISKWFHTNRGLAMGLSSMGTSMGGFVFPWVTSQLIAQQGWQQASLALAILSLLLIVPFSLWVLRRSPPRLSGTVTGEGSMVHKTLSSREILTGTRFWIPVLGLIPVNMAFGGVQFNLGAYMNDLGFEQSMAAALIAVTSVSMILGKLFFGSLGDRVDHRKLYWLMAVCLAVSLLSYVYGRSSHWLYIAAGFQGLATGGVMPMMGIMYSSRFGTQAFGKVLGLVNLFLMCGSLGSLLSGFIFDVTGSYSPAFLFFALLLIPASISMAWLPEPVMDKPKG
ncbi:MAG: MFS transporter [Gammaproteobacteria bacterium]|nr:MFS transporter [Gammaproteobacteria bacterium]